MSVFSILTKLEQTEFAVKIINGTRNYTKIDRKKKKKPLLVSYRVKAHLKAPESQQNLQTRLIYSWAPQRDKNL